MLELKPIVWFGVWWTVLAIAFALCFGAPDVPRLYSVVTQPVSADAQVFSTECPNHGSVNYSYKAENQLYFGRSHLGSECGHLGPGDRIQIYVSRAHLSWSEAGNPKTSLFNELAATGATAVFAASLVVILAYLRSRFVVTAIVGRNFLPAAVTAGVCIQALLISFRDGAWQVLMAPGILAGMTIWGTHGPVTDDQAFMVVINGVDIAVYSVTVLAVIHLGCWFRAKVTA
jgi:hypothetical protein